MNEPYSQEAIDKMRNRWADHVPMTVDDVITAITEAPTDADAVTIMRMQSRVMVLAVADQLYIDPEASLAVIRREIVAEARS